MEPARVSRANRSFRLVCEPGEAAAVEAWLAAQGFAFEAEPFHPLCRVCTLEPFALGDSQAARFGYIYIQDRSSMLPPLALAPAQGSCVLDMCAAPGSKTGFLAQLTGRAGFVLGNKPGHGRLPTLRQNLRRMNLVQAATCSYPGESLPLRDESWDFIQLDPPCSGWGTEAKNPEVRAIWTPEKTGPLVSLQRKLLARAASLLAPGGRALYSTCTTNVEENEAQTLFAMDELGLDLSPLAPPPGFALDAPMLGLSGVVRTDMTAGEGQGFYLALLQKPGSDEPHPDKGAQAAPSLPGRRLDPARLDCPNEPAPAVERLPPGEIGDFAGAAFFLPRAALGLPPGFRWQGFPLGKIVKNRFRPDPRCRALLPPWREGAGLNLTDPAGLSALLSGQSIAAPPGAGLYFHGLPLGWLTRKGKRAIW